MPISNPWLICPNPRPGAIAKLFCFAYAGGGASAFRKWASEIDRDIEVCGIQLPGRENRLREQPFESIAELAPALAEGILPLLDRPFAFYGHSLGGKIAFEVARALRRKRSALPCHIFVGACHAPQLSWPFPQLHDLVEAELIEGIQKRYGGIPHQILEDAELRALLVPALRADLRLMETYRHSSESPLDCAITAFGGLADTSVGRADLEAWRFQTCNAFDLRMVAGDHFFLQTERGGLLRALAAGLKTTTERASPVLNSIAPSRMTQSEIR